MSGDTVHFEPILVYVEELGRRALVARSLPFGSAAVLPREELLVLVDEIRSSIPIVLRQAFRIVDEREQLLAQAWAEAARIIEDARQSAERLAGQTDVVGAAWAAADEIRRESEELLPVQRRELLGWADVMLRQFEDSLEGAQLTVRDARAVLADPGRRRSGGPWQSSLPSNGGS